MHVPSGSSARASTGDAYAPEESRARSVRVDSSPEQESYRRKRVGRGAVDIEADTPQASPERGAPVVEAEGSDVLMRAVEGQAELSAAEAEIVAARRVSRRVVFVTEDADLNSVVNSRPKKKPHGTVGS